MNANSLICLLIPALAISPSSTIWGDSDDHGVVIGHDETLTPTAPHHRELLVSGS